MSAIDRHIRNMPAGNGPRPARLRAGFTLVELLVVIAVIGVLMALLLPAVQSARESGRRTACQANQYQLALASTRYSDTNGLVPGWVNAVSSAAGVTVNCPWVIPLFPFVERMDIYQAIVSGGSLPVSTIELFFCPSMPTDIFTAGAPLCYSGNAGTGLNRKFDGVMVNNLNSAGARNSMEDIASADGTANTLLAGEKYITGTNTGWPLWNDATWNSSSFTGASTITWNSSSPFLPYIGMAPTTLSVLQSGTVKAVNSPVFNAPGQLSQPTSAHPGGAVVAFCDGHTGFLKESLPYYVYAQLLISDNADVPSTASDTARIWRTTRTGSNQYSVLSDADYK